MVDLEVGLFFVSCRFKNIEDGFLWTFSGVYGPVLSGIREDFWNELGAISGLWGGPWCIGGDFNVVKTLNERSKRGRSSSMKRFSTVIEDLGLRDPPL